jgi:hypothetical protein
MTHPVNTISWKWRKSNPQADYTFAQVSIEMGATTWPGEIDLAPDAMREEIKKHGEWRL